MFDGFWENISRYPRYLGTIILGVLLNVFAPIAPLFKRPTTAIASVSFLVALFVFVFFTLRAMLDLDPTI